MSNQFSAEVLQFSQYCSSLNNLVKTGFNQSDLERIAPTKAAPESFKLELKKSTEMLVEIVFYPLPNNLGVFLFYIYNSTKTEPINLKDWLQKHGKLNNPNAFKLANYQGDFEQRLKAFCEFLDSALSDKAMQKVLKGLEWEDMPFAFGD